MFDKKMLLVSTILAAMAPAVVLSQDKGSVASDAVDIAKATEGELITLTGKVTSVSGDRFTLDFGSDQIAVEMDDFNLDNDNAVRIGDSVLARGALDEDFLEGRSLEAGVVYIDRLSTAFYANPADEEQAYFLRQNMPEPFGEDDPTGASNAWASLTGTVAEPLSGGRFQLDVGFWNDVDVTVRDTGRSLDLAKGDRVSVYGKMTENNLFDGRKIKAESVVELSQR